ncbi:MAG: hydroxyacylglutathione hydrolase [Planctomycetota bacterium]|jgi:hydroxyacylglutathione hydrolase|tara:strand:+ start:328 stop:930 length:603 start_codon:yes stop_codon:yes gene_type:complete
MIIVEKLINKPVDSNTYILSDSESENCLIIDPGNQDISKLVHYFSVIGKTPIAILLTHEHFDHIYGVNELLKSYPDIKIYGSLKTIERIQNKRKNLSFYYNQVGYEILNANFEIILDDSITINSFEIKVLKTTGHTDSSLSYLVEKKLFTGDFLIKNESTITKLPSGNRLDFLSSFKKFKNSINESIIYPGHGDVFIFEK